ncbi:MAG: 5-methylthioadenosine/S-adenosylhomocysteine deaminase [Planctomycetota bacterium]
MWQFKIKNQGQEERMKVDTLIFAAWVIPVEPANKVLEEHAIAIKDGKIVGILASDIALTKYQASETYHLPNHALLPGLINSHTHAAMSLFRGIADDLPLMEWLNDHIWPAEQRWVSPTFVEDGTRLAVAEMIRSGTTCFADMYFFPDETATLASAAGIRCVVGLIVIDFPTAWAKDADEYLLKAGQVHHKFRNSPLVNTAFAPHSPYAVSEEALIQLNTLAEEMDIPIQMHVHETAREIEQSLEQHGLRPMQRLEELGLLSPRLLAVHMTQLDPGDIELITRYGVNVIHCPESNLKLASGFCPVHKLQTAGVNVALGTDGAASNNDLDMIGEMHTAALLAKGVANDCAAVNAFTALKMATINGARALGLQDSVGSLRRGKQADIIAIDLSELESQPLYDPVSQIVYTASRNQVSDVWVAGKQLLRSRELLTLNETQVKLNVAKWREKLY